MEIRATTITEGLHVGRLGVLVVLDPEDQGGEGLLDFVEEGVAMPTTKGIITYAADGAIRIVPVRP